MLIACLQAYLNNRKSKRMTRRVVFSIHLWRLLLCQSFASYKLFCAWEVRLYGIASIDFYCAAQNARQSEALQLRETHRNKHSLERTKRGSWSTPPVHKDVRVKGGSCFQRA